MRVRAFREGRVFLQKRSLTIYFNINFTGDQLFYGSLNQRETYSKIEKNKKETKSIRILKKKFQKKFKDLKLSIEHEHAT